MSQFVSVSNMFQEFGTRGRTSSIGFMAFTRVQSGIDLDSGTIDVTNIVMYTCCVIVSCVLSNFPLTLHKSLMSDDIIANIVALPLRTI
jgi:hypothetical protein